jgi:hypothetical protein
MATKKKNEKKKDTEEVKKVMTPEEKAAKRKARMEAIKNRPAVQRPNGKQIDVIQLGEGREVQNYGYAIKNKDGHQGVIVTSVVVVDCTPVSSSITFVPGNLTVKSKKNHGVISSKKSKKDKEENKEDED